MRKDVIKDDVYYSILWSQLYRYDRHEATRILPELPGILWLLYLRQSKEEHLMFYSCWRDGCRDGLRNLMDGTYRKLPEVRRQLDTDRLFYRYTVIDSSMKDLQDIMFWLINSYTPRFNNAEGFQDSKRYRNIYVKESERKKDDVVDRMPMSWKR